MVYSSSMQIRAVLMDLDGTLIDSIPLILTSVRATIKHFGFKCSNQELRKLSMLHSRDIAYYFMDKNKISFKLSDFINYRRNYFLELLKKNDENWFNDAKPFIKEISKKYKVGIVTGSRWIFINEVFDAGIKNHLECIVTSDDVTHTKPDIEPLEMAIGKIREKKDEVIFIGDSIQDALMCQRFGIKFIGKATGISTRKELLKFNPLFVAKNFKEIKDYLGA